ncbi:hypothetical protein C0Q70_15023 [Pomacea canaliculata]|uniref:Uncharacterized protein n=1 Tax=Pomacea canaliculata TaxID=400727 RepID=A0A2T7NTM9_POMCA|nr:hypothetical protein C0Q70_15023 [Pomacea canaliculata]
MVYYSDAVFLGTVLRHIDDPLKPGSFVAEMKVSCIYKGAPVPAIVNISDADGLGLERAVKAERMKKKKESTRYYRWSSGTGITGR